MSADSPSSTRTATWRTKIAEWFRTGFVPEEIGAVEWLVMRAGFAALVLWTIWDPHPFDFPGQPSPVGIARFVNLSWLHRDGMHDIIFGITAVLSLIYVAGFALRWVLPLMLVAHDIVRTYNNSQGFTHHGFQLVTMVLLVQTLVVWWKDREGTASLRAWLWYYSRGMVLFSYIASAITKLINTRGLWIWRSQYLTIDIVKSWRLAWFKNLDPEFANIPPATFWLTHHPAAAQIIFGAGFLLEVFAFLGLRDRRWSAFIGLSIVTMHFCIERLMQLTFVNHLWLCLIFLINPVGWMLLLARRNQASPLVATT